jgi:hypothetical protein
VSTDDPEVREGEAWYIQIYQAGPALHAGVIEELTKKMVVVRFFEERRQNYNGRYPREEVRFVEPAPSPERNSMDLARDVFKQIR